MNALPCHLHLQLRWTVHQGSKTDSWCCWSDLAASGCKSHSATPRPAADPIQSKPGQSSLQSCWRLLRILFGLIYYKTIHHIYIIQLIKPLVKPGYRVTKVWWPFFLSVSHLLKKSKTREKMSIWQQIGFSLNVWTVIHNQFGNPELINTISREMG